MVVSTGTTFPIFSFPSFMHHCTLENDTRPVVQFPRQVVFAEGGNKVVGGTDLGYAVVFDVKEAKIVQKLEYPKGGLVQPVAVSDSQDRVFSADIVLA